MVSDLTGVLYNRDHFFLHGGAAPYSHGCIDVGGGIYGDSDTDRLKDAILQDTDNLVPLDVIYTYPGDLIGVSFSFPLGVEH